MNFRGKLGEQVSESAKVGRIHESGQEKSKIPEIPMVARNLDSDGLGLSVTQVHYRSQCGWARKSLKIVVNFLKIQGQINSFRSKTTFKKFMNEEN